MVKVKSVLKAFGLGLIGVMLLSGFMYFITLDLRWVSILASVFFFFAGRYGSKSTIPDFLRLSLYLVSPSIFLFIILAELPSLYILIPLVVLSTLLGHWLKSRNQLAVKRSALVLLLSALLLFSFYLVPKLVQQQLVKIVYTPSPDFSFVTIGGEKIAKSDLKGKIVLLDFFGTWCKPCIQELKELAPLAGQYYDIPFYVISSAQGGDTIEKVKDFASKSSPAFQFGYDEGGTMHQSFGFTGVPALVILDRQGNIRMMHEGYNVSENLSSVIFQKIEQLKRE